MNLLDRAVSLTLPAVPKPLVRYFSKRYIAGVDIDEAFGVVRSLHKLGAMSTLDILGEFITSREEAAANTAEYVALIDRIHEERLPEANVSVKLTSLGLLLDQQFCMENVRKLLKRAEATDNFIRIDMEDSECTSSTLAIYRTARQEFPERVGIVLQSRLRRTLPDLVELTDQPTNIRLCKGIYLEPRKIAYLDAEIIRRNFVEALETIFKRGAYVGIATHDEQLAYDALRLIREYGLTPDQYEFQMLLGVDEELRSILIETGHRMRVYVPYGKRWYAYSVRRLRENPQLAGYALKAIFKRG